MYLYETGFLLSPGLSDEENDGFILQMADVVSQKKGNLIKQDRWGKRKLAYPIKKSKEAFYVFFLYEGTPDIPTELERRFKQSDAVLRFLTLRRELKESVRKKKRSREVEKKEAAAQESSPSDKAADASFVETIKEEVK